MSAVTFQQMADRIAALMEERLRIGGSGLKAKLKKGGRLLPRRVRAAAHSLAETAELAQNPKLLAQLDPEKAAADYDLCLKHLNGVTRKAIALPLLLGLATTLGLAILLLAGLWYFIRSSQGGI